MGRKSCGRSSMKLRKMCAIVLPVLILTAGMVTATPLHHRHLRGTHYTVDSGAPNQPAVNKPYIEARNSTYHGAGPREEARAMCSVRTQEVNATANATITRRLHGVVTSRELHNAIQRLELIIFGQMQQLWQSLDALRSQLAGNPQATYPDRHTVAFRYQPNVG